MPKKGHPRIDELQTIYFYVHIEINIGNVIFQYEFLTSNSK